MLRWWPSPSRLHLVVLFFILHAGASARSFSVYFVSVGQGDSEFLELPSGKTVLIDGGPNSSLSDENPVLKFLNEQGVTRLDYVVLTHAHSDHYNGLLAAASKYPVGVFYDTRVDNSRAKGDDHLRALIKEMGATIIYPRVGDTLDWDASLAVQVLNAGPAEWVSTSDGKTINNDSLVLRILYNSSTYLFTGDAEADAEQAILSHSTWSISADVRKVAHHGSRYTSSTTFLNAVHPKYAIIEVGPNTYGHPTQETLDRLAARGATVYRTDKDGTLVLETEGDGKYTIRRER